MQVIVESEQANFTFVCTDSLSPERLKKRYKRGMSTGEIQAESYEKMVPALLAQLHASGIAFHPPSDLVWRGRTKAMLSLN